MKKINKLFSFLILLIIMLSGINAVSLNSNQDFTQQRYNDADIATISSIATFGSDNFNYSINNNTFVYDVRTYMNYLDTDYYISFNNKNVNDSLQIILTTIPISGTPIATTYNVSMLNVGDYKFLVKPSYPGENIRIEINAPDNYVGDINYISVKNKYVDNMNTITGTFVGATKDLIDINVSVWKIFYYILIIGLIISSLGLLISFAFRVYDWADDLSGKKKQIFQGGK